MMDMGDRKVSVIDEMEEKSEGGHSVTNDGGRSKQFHS